MPYAAEDADVILPRALELREQRRRAMVGNPPPVVVESAGLPRCQCPQIGGYGEAYRLTVDSCAVHGASVGRLLTKA